MLLYYQILVTANIAGSQFLIPTAFMVMIHSTLTYEAANALFCFAERVQCLSLKDSFNQLSIRRVSL